MDSLGRRRKSVSWEDDDFEDDEYEEYMMGGHHVDNESIRSKSSLDIRHADHEGNATGGTQTPSRRKRIWDSFRKGARKLRHSRSREKLNKKNRNEAQFQSQPNISTTSTTDSPLVRARTVTPIPRPESMATQELDVFMTAAAEQQQDKSHDKQDSFRQERSFSDKSNGGDKDSIVDRESEVDSGIAVVENGTFKDAVLW